MNIILVSETEVAEKTIILTDNRASHIVEILKGKPGEVVRVGIINGRKGEGTIVDIVSRKPYQVELSLDLSEESAPSPPIDLILALPRPIMLRRIFSQAAALGFGSLFIINANRVEKSFWEAGLLQENTYREHLIHGLEQAVETTLPQVIFYKRFKPFIEDDLPSMLHGYSHCLLAHPYGGRTLKDVLTGSPGRILLAVGPEGGWVDYEVRRFLETGFSAFTMGSRILKVDTAVISLHGRISALLE